MKISFFYLCLIKNPNSYANLTKAISSGLEACKILWPSSVTGVTLLHKINAVDKSLNKHYCLLLAFFFCLSIKKIFTFPYHEHHLKDH